MNAINPLSTRSPPPWVACIRPSRAWLVLQVALALLAFYAVWLCPLTLAMRLLLCISVAVASTGIWHSVNATCQLARSSDGRWHIVQRIAGQRERVISGQLSRGSYRTGWLVILVIRVDNQTDIRADGSHVAGGATAAGRTHTVMIWRDSMCIGDFSWLQLRFAMPP